MPRPIAVSMMGLVAVGCLLTEPDFGGMPIHDLSREGEITLSADARYADDTLRVIVRITNTGSTTGTLSTGWCSFAVRGLSVSGEGWDNGDVGNCPDGGRIYLVNTGQTVEISGWRFVRDWGTLPKPGSYNVTVYYREGDDLKGMGAGRVTVPAR